MKVQDGDLWIDEDTYFPCYLVDGDSTAGCYYQVDLSADLGAAYEPLLEMLEEKGIQPSGYLWQVMILAWVEEKDAALAESIECDTESETCGLVLNTEANQLKVAEYVLQLLNSRADFDRILARLQADPDRHWCL